MKVVSKLLTAQNNFVNEVFNTLNEFAKTPPVNDEEAAQKEAALIIAGILTGVKVSMMQAIALIQEMELDEIGES